MDLWTKKKRPKILSRVSPPVLRDDVASSTVDHLPWVPLLHLCRQPKDPPRTTTQLEKGVGIGSAAINTVINDHLKYRKLVSRWIPHSLTVDQKFGHVKWCNFMLEKNWMKLFLILLQVTKLGFTILIQTQNGNLLFGALQNHFLLRKFAKLEMLENKWSLIERQLIVTGIQQNTFQQYLKKIKPSRPRAQLRGVLLHHDNARPHTSAQTLNLLANSGVQLVTHPPYSPDLAPWDFFFYLFLQLVFLFPKDKLLLKEIKFDTHNETLQAFINAVNSIPKDDCCKCFDNWFSRMKSCIGAKDDYFEKL
ncbi:hypothetical protein LAZ67_3001729 [Cordylochernes scorpioides]|uniref:Transposase n=1 Tax=Cordylochernes scorpioides TaxID=51811 RepID=A0ABY6K8W9_9ARAC|nr:hypothetical protein LAZ67_3001729 [Cordylochernes scorpioides]